MLVKLAWGNARRAARDFSVYFLTLAFAVCLLYSFLASGDYLLALSLTDAQRASFAKAGEVLVAFAVLIDVIFCFLLGYANAFLLRRRKREFGLYLLLGLRHRQVAGVLLAECALASVAALACGLVAGVATSPVFGLIAAYVFGAPWRPEVVLAPAAALQTALTFLIICVIAAGFSVAGICRRPLVELMGAERVPERKRLAGAAPLRVQRVAAAVLLAIVWGTCLLNPGYFIIFVIPMGVCALVGTYFLMRVLAVRAPERLRARPDRYWCGLAPFTVRQLEARAESGALAMAAESVLLAASMCLMVVGFAFSAGLRGPQAPAGAAALAPVAFACVFYGAAFLVAAIAVLALQQLAQMPAQVRSCATLHVLGAPETAVRASLRTQVAVHFATPLAFALLHCLFGFALIGMISIMMGAEGFPLFALGVVAVTVMLLAGYYALTTAACVRQVAAPRA